MLIERYEPYPTRRSGAPNLIYFSFLIVFLVATRIPLGPRYLYYFDSANFALSLENFNPALHQPQPPGYPLFVLLIRFIHLWVARPEQVLMVAGLLAATAAIVAGYFLARQMFGNTAALLSAALLVSTPAFWYAGITNQIRLCLAMASMGVGLVAWNALKRPHDPRWLYASFAALGIASGFRPETSAILLPLLLWVWWRTGHRFSRLAIGGGILIGCAAPWIAIVTWAVGGPHSFLGMLQAYSQDQFGRTSFFFGATPGHAYNMFLSALVWTFLGAVVWLWAIPYAGKRVLGDNPAETGPFLAIGFLPPFALSAFIHIGDPDQALAAIAFLSIFGAGAVAAAMQKARWRSPYLVAGILIAAHAFLFFRPLPGPAKIVTFRNAERVDNLMSSAIDTVRAIHSPHPLTIVHYGSAVASREISYYFPDAYVVVLPGPGASPGAVAQVFHEHKPYSVLQGPNFDLESKSTRVICLMPPNSPSEALPGWARSGAVFYRRIGDTRRFSVGPYRFFLGGL
jgi:4-amino-4-deoxy-L-arabinose transferase-like glycosyltransferase